MADAHGLEGSEVMAEAREGCELGGYYTSVNFGAKTSKFVRLNTRPERGGAGSSMGARTGDPAPPHCIALHGMHERGRERERERERNRVRERERKREKERQSESVIMRE